MSKEQYPSSEPEFFERFTGAIDLSDGKPLTLAPLEGTALLVMGNDYLAIVPEDNAPAGTLQDYKLFNVSEVTNSIEESGQDAESIISMLRQTDRSFEDKYGMLDGVARLKHDEVAQVGRHTMPQLGFGRTVSGIHLKIENTDAGLTIQDLDSTNGTHLFVTPEDASRELPHVPEAKEKLSPESHKQLLDAFQSLEGSDGSFVCKTEELKVYGGDIRIQETGQLGVEVYIETAKAFPEFDPKEGYVMTQFVLEAGQDEVTIFEGPDYRSEDGKGISKVHRQRPMNDQEAEKLLQLVDTVRNSKQ